MTEPIRCPECGKDAQLVGGEIIYPNRDDLFSKQFWACMDCNVWAGCHPGTTKRVGSLAGADTRKLRQQAHFHFDPLWKEKIMTRSEAYEFLRKELNLNQHECHIGWMSDSDLMRIPTIVSDYLTQQLRKYSEDRTTDP